MTDAVEDLPAPSSRLRRASAVVLAAVVLGALGWVVLESSLLGVDDVQVRGTSRVTPAQVEQAAGVALGMPLARVDVEAVRSRVLQLAPVASVTVARRWPGTLSLRVVERRPAAGVVEPGKVTLLDRTGVAFAVEPRLPPGTVRLQVAHPGPRDATTRSALSVLDELPGPLLARVAIVRAPSPTSVSLLLRDGRQVVWGAPGRAGDKAAAAQALLRLPGSVYDVTSPDVVVRRGPAGVPGVTPSPTG
ncbi:MAG: cell division protein FtsQ [Frankiales bacterium]|nr:cell division protein FtsQ [Frankiales bacterium]